jgi:hypothetical protein
MAQTYRVKLFPEARVGLLPPPIIQLPPPYSSVRQSQSNQLRLHIARADGDNDVLLAV